MPHRLDRLAVIVNGLGRVADEIAHCRPGNGTRFDIARDARCPLIRVVGGLVQDDARRPGRAGDHAERLCQSGRRVIRRCVERREQLRQVGLQLFPPRQRLGHVVHAARDRAELTRLILGQRLHELPLSYALQCLGDAGKRSSQTAAVVPEAETQHDQHGDEQHAGGHRGLHGIVAGIGGQLGGGRGFGGDKRGWAEALNAVEPLGQLDHGRLRGASAAPSRDLRDEAHECYRNERRGEEAGDARRRPHGAP